MIERVKSWPPPPPAPEQSEPSGDGPYRSPAEASDRAPSKPWAPLFLWLVWRNDEPDCDEHSRAVIAAYTSDSVIAFAVDNLEGFHATHVRVQCIGPLIIPTAVLPDPEGHRERSLPFVVCESFHAG